MDSEETQILLSRIKTLEDQVLNLREEHDRFFKTELLNIRNDIKDLKRNSNKRR